MKNKIILSLLFALNSLSSLTIAMPKNHKQKHKVVTTKNNTLKENKLEQFNESELEAIVAFLEQAVKIMTDYNEVDSHLESLVVTRTRLYDIVAKLKSDSHRKINSYLEELGINIDILFSLFDEYLPNIKNADQKMQTYETIEDHSEVEYLAQYLIENKELSSKIIEFWAMVDVLEEKQFDGKSFVQRYKELSDFASKHATQESQEIYKKYKDRIEQDSDDKKITLFLNNAQTIFNYLIADIASHTKSNNKIHAALSWNKIITTALNTKRFQFLNSCEYEDLEENYTYAIKAFKKIATQMFKPKSDKIQNAYTKLNVELTLLKNELNLSNLIIQN